ncbi:MULTISPECIES: hypothetical protein [Nocardiaceae]|jgi:putative membrane protein|uniref:SHOCT domain-containing protein n=5 Tax=root TaxID=1 RepID=A0ABU4CWE6_9NOCA|nr:MULTISPECIES: hypothetical protein [Rhodococcus]KJV03659.1 hypothetical protein VF34_01019 [Rhodococcus sp. PML026]MCJ0894360.1 hypothetical protein [Rhodococcus sp. ARC_M5]MCJ0980568.1 hypothetical protein [Rhodococcus sp. ARC_M12]MCX6490386.1 hypothetical protein [Rhodococcus sp. (in: high G+C Gram-positive bacteria)]MCZ4561852.1 hypothetical protein [Rhodococcus sp. IEGM 1401]
MMNMGTMSGGWTMMAGMAAFWLVVIALLIWGAVRLMSARPQSGEDAQEILDRRFAAGEIDRDFYRAAVAELATAALRKRADTR